MEQEPRLSQDSDYLEKLLLDKGPRLSVGVRRHIRWLKQEGRWEEAVKSAREAREKKGETRRRNLVVELHKALLNAVEAEDPKVQAEEEVRFTWLSQITGFIDQSQRTEEITEILTSRGPEIEEYLVPRLPHIRDEFPKIPPPSR